ncbi:hypothetical protein [Streptosporangium sp. NPDC002721]|uniref:hypothetical protein n=1 Tax=Streptosporangium sp. NPDC002721 TaxID=3366188 RepID=UPI0036C75584
MKADSVTLLAEATSGDDPIVSLGATVELRRELERLEAVLVRRARTQGRTWTRIAAALGISKQAVHRKYGGRGLFRNQE